MGKYHESTEAQAEAERPRTLNVLVYSLIVLAVCLSGIAAWQRYPKGPRSELGDMLEQKTNALLPNPDVIDSWTPVGGLPRGMMAAQTSCFVCTQCQSLAWTPAGSGNPACPFCGLAMVVRQPDQQGVDVSVVGGTAPCGATALITIQAGAKRPHADRGPCTNCHTVVGSRSPRLALTPAGAARSTPVWHAFSTRGVDRLETGTTPAITADAVKPTLIKQFGIEVCPAPGAGVKVTGVMGNSYASNAGLRPGDIILQCNRTKVRDVEQFQRLVSNSPPEADALIKIMRTGRTKDLLVMVGEGEMEGFTPIKTP